MQMEGGASAPGMVVASYLYIISLINYTYVQ